MVLHGGCFQQGDESWNGEQCVQWVETLGMHCMTMDFRQTTWDDTVADLLAGVKELQQRYPTLPLMVIGCSSGGYMSLRLAKLQCMSKYWCVALCPVADPALRFDYLAETNSVLSPATRQTMRAQQLKYWQTYELMQEAATQVLPTDSSPYLSPTLIVFAETDHNVPLSTITPFLNAIEKQSNSTIVLRTRAGGHEICSKPCTSVTQLISEFIIQQQQQS